MEQIANFPANYQLNFDAELPATGGSFKIFSHGNATPHGCDGPLVRIEPKNGVPWLACFCKGYEPGQVADGAYTTPNSDIVCVVSKGAGFWVDTVKRESTNIPAFPIRQVEYTKRLLIFADFTNLATFGSNGLLWISDRLVWDNLVIKTVDADKDRIVCQGWNPLASRDVEVIVNLKTGEKES